MLLSGSKGVTTANQWIVLLRLSFSEIKGRTKEENSKANDEETKEGKKTKQTLAGAKGLEERKKNERKNHEHFSLNPPKMT